MKPFSDHSKLQLSSLLLARSTRLVLGCATLSAFGAELHVPAKYASIQAAVKAGADGDTIQIASGVYTEQVEIRGRKLTLLGQPGTILRATEQMTSYPDDPRGNFPVMYVIDSQVTVRGLTFEGERLADRLAGLGTLRGMWVRRSNATIENCGFYGFREGTPNHIDADALAVFNTIDNAPEINVRVAGCTFADDYQAMWLIGSGSGKTINITVENNTIIGLGPLDTDLNYAGIQVAEGVGGRIANNTISGFSYIGTVAEFPISYGILAVNQANYPPDFGLVQPLVIEGNTFRDNQVHIGLVKADRSAVKNNHFQGTAPGIFPLGMAVTGKDVLIANNEFEDMPEGIRLFGLNDADFGDLVGAAAGTQVTSNRFCNVPKTITVGAGADATQQGTLICPFPSTVLDIADAVLLSWPNFEEGYVVETAPRVDGPWTASDAVPWAQDGHFSVTFPATSENRFFRLKKL